MVAAVAAATVGVLARTLPVDVVAAVVAALAVILVISINPVPALAFLAVARASLEALQDRVLFNPGGIGISPTDILSMAFVGGAVLWLVREVRAGNEFWRNPLVGWAVTLVFASVITLLWSPDAALGAKDLVKWSAAFSAFAVVIASPPDVRRLRRLVALVVAGAALPIAIGLWQFAVSVGRIASHGGLRVEGPFTHPNFFGAYLVTVLVAVWGLRQVTTGWRRRAAHAVGVGAVAALTLTLSRSSWIGFALVVIVVGSRHRRIIAATFAGAAGVALVAPRFVGRALDAFRSTPVTGVAAKGDVKAGNSLLTRMNIWTDQIGQWTERPFFGHGWGYTYSAQEHGSHNDYLRVLLEGGVVGLVAFLGLLITLVRKAAGMARRRDDLPLAFLGLTLAYVVESAGLNVISKEAYQFYFWLLAGISFVWAQTVPAPGRTSSEPAAEAVAG